MNIQRKKFKNGKLPGFAWGLPEWSNLLGNAAGYFTAKADKTKIDAEPISRPNTYLSNANAPQALYILGQQQENPYAIMPDLYNTYAKGMYALSNNGGLSGGQRALARLSAINNLTANAAKMQLAAQAANIGHRQTYADAMLRYGAMDALNRMAALQHDYNAYNQAHGAKQLMSSQRQTDAMNYLLNGVRGNNDLYMWRKMMDNWDRDYNANHPSKTLTYPSFGIDTTTRNYISGVKPDEELDFWDEFKRFGRIPTASSYVPNYQNIPVPNFSFPKSIKTRKKSIKRK